MANLWKRVSYCGIECDVMCQRFVKYKDDEQPAKYGLQLPDCLEKTTLNFTRQNVLPLQKCFQKSTFTTFKSIRNNHKGEVLSSHVILSFKMSSVISPFTALALLFLSIIFGQRPQRRQSPVEHRGNLSTHLSVCPSVHPPVHPPPYPQGFVSFGGPFWPKFCQIAQIQEIWPKSEHNGQNPSKIA